MMQNLMKEIVEATRLWKEGRKVFYSVKNADLLLVFAQTDRAAMLDEIVDYVKFLRLQVKVCVFQLPIGL